MTLTEAKEFAERLIYELEESAYELRLEVLDDPGNYYEDMAKIESLGKQAEMLRVLLEAC